MNDTRTKILNVAEDLVQRVGLNAMSYKNISDEVGIRKASIHHHFPKKENLIDELLKRCELSYGEEYSQIANGDGTALVKLKKLSEVFEAGLRNEKLCLVGSISTDSKTLGEGSCHILKATIEKTVTIFAEVFEQGRQEKSLQLEGTSRDSAFAFLSSLIGAQAIGRSIGGVEQFQQAAKVVIAGFRR